MPRLCARTITNTPPPPPLHIQNAMVGEKSATETTAKSETYKLIQELAQNNYRSRIFFSPLLKIN